MSTIPSPQPTTGTLSGEGTLSQFEQDVQTQIAIDNGDIYGGDGPNAGIPFPNVSRMSPDGVAWAIYDSGDCSGYFSVSNGSGWKFSNTPQAYYNMEENSYVGDVYGMNGYEGSGTGAVTEAVGNPEGLYSWVGTGPSTPNPNPTPPGH